MKNKLRQVISALITEELNEMARIATTLAIGDTTKLAKAKSLFGSDNWIGKMIAAVESAGEAGITRDALIDATDKNQLALNPKIKDFIEIGLFIEAGLETAKKEKSAGAGSGLRGRKASDKTLVAKEVNSKLEADNEYQADEAELTTLGAEFIEKLRMRVKGTLKRGRKADPTKVKDGMKKTLKGIMGLDTDEDGIIDDFEDEDVIDESLKVTNKTNKTMKKPLNEEFKRMQKLAGLNEYNRRENWTDPKEWEGACERYFEEYGLFDLKAFEKEVYDNGDAQNRLAFEIAQEAGFKGDLDDLIDNDKFNIYCNYLAKYFLLLYGDIVYVVKETDPKYKKELDYVDSWLEKHKDDATFDGAEF